jgi:hypothetical protein
MQRHIIWYTSSGVCYAWPCQTLMVLLHCAVTLLACFAQCSMLATISVAGQLLELRWACDLCHSVTGDSCALL